MKKVIIHFCLITITIMICSCSDGQKKSAFEVEAYLSDNEYSFNNLVNDIRKLDKVSVIVVDRAIDDDYYEGLYNDFSDSDKNQFERLRISADTLGVKHISVSKRSGSGRAEVLIRFSLYQDGLLVGGESQGLMYVDGFEQFIGSCSASDACWPLSCLGWFGFYLSSE